MLGGTEQERSAWLDECFAKNLDWLAVKRAGKMLHLDCLVHPSHQLSDLAYLEITEMLGRLDARSSSLGKTFRGNASQFECTLPGAVPLQELVKEVQEILRHDRTPRRRVERQAMSAPAEGLALALDSSGLWDDHDPLEPVYVMELDGKPGRCLVLKHLHPVLIDLPLSSFRILSEFDA